MDNPGVEVIARLEDDPTEVARARHLLTRTLQTWGVDADALDVAVLLTSELVTNAIRHGTPPVLLRIGEGSRGALRVEVDDVLPGQVVPMEADLWALGGRGLQMVDALADRWGCRSNLSGKRVWFEVMPDGLSSPP